MRKQHFCRRAIVLLLTVAMVIAMPTFVGAAPTSQWELSGGTLTVSGTGETGTSPQAVSVQKDAVTRLVIDEGITQISTAAFVDFPALETVEFPSTLKQVGESAFSGCTSLGEIKLPDGVESIERLAFYGCSNLTVAGKILPDTISLIDDQAFDGCSRLDLVALPLCATDLVLGEATFRGTDLHSLHNLRMIYRHYPHIADDGIAHVRSEDGIPAACFMGSQLESISFDNRIVCARAFADCANLTHVDMPAVYNIGNRAFANCVNLEIFTFPESLTNIGNQCFYMCRKISAGRMPMGASPEWHSDNFIGAGLGLIVEVYVEGLDGGYNYRNSFTLPARALWMVAPDTTGKTPEIRVYFDGNTLGFEGDSISEAMSGKDIFFTVADMDDLPGSPYRLVAGDDTPFRLNSSINPQVVRLYYQSAEMNNNYRVEHYLVSEDGVVSWQNSEGLFAPIGTHVAAEPHNYIGYRLDLDYPGTVTSGTVTEDGKLICKLFYAKANTPVASKEGIYTVEHYIAADGAYSLYRTEQKSGVIGYSVNASAITINGYMENTDHPERVATGTITADGALALQLYYDMIPQSGAVIVSGGRSVQQFGTLTVTSAPSNAGSVAEATSSSANYKRYTITPGTNHRVLNVTLDGEALGSVMEFSVRKDGRTHQAEVIFDCPSLRFEDVATTAWYHEVVDDVILKGYMIGTGDYTEQDIIGGYSSKTGLAFAPENSMTRAEVAQTMLRACAGKTNARYTTYTDVARSAWYGPAVIWATEQGIVNGYGDGTFGPNDVITREQFVTILHRYAGAPKATEAPDAPDAGNISAFASEAVAWAVQQGVIHGDENGCLLPQGALTRAQAAALISRFFK